MPHGPIPEKSSTYFALLEALLKPGCAICHLMAGASASYLDTLYYEQVTDVGVRRKLRQARGLCGVHARGAREITPAALGVAIIAKDLLEEECLRLAALESKTFWRRLGDFAQSRLPRQALLAYLRGWHRRGLCPVCQVAAEHERHAMDTLLNFLHDDELARRFESSGGLCVPHLVRTVEGDPAHPGLGLLIATQRRLYARLVAELDEFCRKHDYRFAQEPWGAEADAWQRALDLLAGRAAPVGGGLRGWSRRGAAFLRELRSWWR
jgi:hypothetical protein